MMTDIRVNIRRIVALVLTAAVFLSNDYIVKADTDIVVTQDIEESMLVEEEIVQNSNELEPVPETIGDENESVDDTIIDEIDLSTEEIIDDDSDSEIVVEETEVLPEYVTDEGETESEPIIEEDMSENPIGENCEGLVLEESFLAEDVEDSICEDGAILSAEDKKERNDDTIGETSADYDPTYSLGKKLRQYLAAKYPAMDTNHDNVVTTAEMQDNTTYTTIEIKGSDFPEISKNMVQFRELSNIANVDTVIFDGVDEIRNFYLPKTTKNLIIRNTTLNLISSNWGSILGGNSLDNYALPFSSFNLETFVLDNVTIGNRFETVDKDN